LQPENRILYNPGLLYVILRSKNPPTVLRPSVPIGTTRIFLEAFIFARLKTTLIYR